MSSRIYLSLIVILIIICLDISSVSVVVTALAEDLKISRHNNYNLDEGSVIYEAYYPNAQNMHQEKQHYDRGMILERSFQVPLDHIAYQPVSDNKQPNVVDNRNLSEEQQRMVEIRGNYEATDKSVPFHDQRLTIAESNTNTQATKIEEIFKFIRKAISQDLQNWNALEEYLKHLTSDQLSQTRTYLTERRKDEKDNNNAFQANWIDLGLSKQPSYKALRNLETRDIKQRPIYFEEIDTSGNAIAKKTSISEIQVTNIPIMPDSLILENIFQPRPQFIKYKFFKKPVTQIGEHDKKIINNFILRNYRDTPTTKEAIDKGHGKLLKENIEVTSIQVSELPRHKTRHHHGEWPKRDYSNYRHRSSTDFNIA